MTRREQLGYGNSGVWEQLLEAPEDDWIEIVASQTNAHEDWRALALRGGFPVSDR